MSAVQHDSKNGISRLTDFTLASVCVYSGLYLDRVERGVAGAWVYVFVDPQAAAVSLEAELDEYTVEARATVEAVKVVMVCQNKLRFAERDRKAREY
jgi:hypothetical protein